MYICICLSSGVASHLECEQEVGAPHHAEEPRRCTGEQQQSGEKADHGEVFDIPINGTDEFQVSPPSISSDNIVFVCVCVHVCVYVCVLVGRPALWNQFPWGTKGLGSEGEVKLDLLSLPGSLFVRALTKLVLTACLVDGKAPLSTPLHV